jgi:hypothetical protein
MAPNCIQNSSVSFGRDFGAAARESADGFLTARGPPRGVRLLQGEAR